MFKGLAGIALVVVGLVVSGWGLWHISEAPMPARTLGGFGYVQYETSVQLKAIFGGFGAVALGAWAFWSAVTPTRRRKRNRRASRHRRRGR